MVDFKITDTIRRGEVGNADRIWASTPQNLASKAVYVSPELISESPFEYIQDVIKFGDL